MSQEHTAIAGRVAINACMLNICEKNLAEARDHLEKIAVSLLNIDTIASAAGFDRNAFSAMLEASTTKMLEKLTQSSVDLNAVLVAMRAGKAAAEAEVQSQPVEDPAEGSP